MRGYASWTRQVITGAVVAAAGVGMLTSCESPFQMDPNERSTYNYASAVLARDVATGPGAVPMNSPTVNLGVRVYPSPYAATPIQPAVIVGPNGVPTTQKIDDVAPVRTFPTTEPANYGQPEGVIRLSLQDTIGRALAHSLAIKVEAYNPGIKEAQITSALATFDPVFFAQSQFLNQDEPPDFTTSLNGLSWTNQVGIRKNLSSGGNAQFSFSDVYRDLLVSLYTPPPKSSHSGAINFTLSQPLLRGFGANVTEANIYLAQRDRSIALETFRRQVISTVANVEEAYYTLGQASAAVDIRKHLFEGTRDTYIRIRDRWLIDADLIQIKQAQSAYESRQADLIRDESTLRKASDQLKSLLNDPELDLRGNLLLLPADRPTDAPLSFNIANQVDLALRYRTELQEARLQIEQADIIVNVSRNDLLPKADLQVYTQSNTETSGLDTAFSSTWDAAKYIDYAAGLKIEIPLGNRQAEAEYKRRILERRKAVTQMLGVAQQVIADVKNQLREVLTTYAEIEARQSARVSAAEQLNAITQRELVEKLTPEFLNLKLQAQGQLAQAEFDEMTALINYNLAIMRLEQAKGTLLEYNRIAIGPAPVKEEGPRIRFLGDSYKIPGPAH